MNIQELTTILFSFFHSGPYNDLIAIRLAIFTIFAFYGLMHLLHRSKEVYPVHFLKNFLFMPSTIGLTVFMKKNTEVSFKRYK